MIRPGAAADAIDALELRYALDDLG